MKRWILWDFSRATWQYDVLVGLILAFIFLTPRAWFRDQPRANNVIALPTEDGRQVFWLEPHALAGLSDPEQQAKAVQLVQPLAGSKPRGVQITPIYNAEQEIKGYMVYALK